MKYGLTKTQVVTLLKNKITLCIRIILSMRNYYFYYFKMPYYFYTL